MKLSLFFILTTLVASLVALPIVNHGFLVSDNSSDPQGHSKAIQHKAIPATSSHKATSFSQQLKPIIDEQQGATSIDEAESSTAYQNLEARKFGKLMLKLAKSKIGKKIADALDWRPEWQKKMTPEQRKELGKCKPTWHKPRCYSR
ncbi:hypothetical protein M408DRAFT_328975, partial [Serendipita vermifera MAFF 305830]